MKNWSVARHDRPLISQLSLAAGTFQNAYAAGGFWIMWSRRGIRRTWEVTASSPSRRMGQLPLQLTNFNPYGRVGQMLLSIIFGQCTMHHVYLQSENGIGLLEFRSALLVPECCLISWVRWSSMAAGTARSLCHRCTWRSASWLSSQIFFLEVSGLHTLLAVLNVIALASTIRCNCLRFYCCTGTVTRQEWHEMVRFCPSFSYSLFHIEFMIHYFTWSLSLWH